MAAGIYLGSKLTSVPVANNNNKINEVLGYIQQEYVDTINNTQLVDQSIEKSGVKVSKTG